MSTNLSLNAAFANANTAYQVKYAELYENALPGAYQIYTDQITGVDTETTEFDWATNHPMMREWIGPRREAFLRAYTQQIKLKTYERLLSFERKTLVLRDKTGAVARGIKTFLSQQVAAYDLTGYTAYMSASGAGPTGYDGVALFANAHPHSGSGGNQSNLSAGTNLNAATYDAAQTAMNSYTLENGEPAGMVGTHLVIGPNLKTRARQLFGASTRLVTVDASGKLDAAASVVAAGAVQNMYDGEVTIVVDMRRVGTPAYYWDLVDCSKSGIRPMVQLIHRAPTPIHQDQMTDPARFSRDRVYFGLEGDWVFAAGMWMSAYRATGTA